jgi:hypothetical protein
MTRMSGSVCDLGLDHFLIDEKCSRFTKGQHFAGWLRFGESRCDQPLGQVRCRQAAAREGLAMSKLIKIAAGLVFVSVAPALH